MTPAATLNSTNVRQWIRFALHRADLAVRSVLAPEKAVDKAARLFTTPPRFAHRPREVELLATGVRHDVPFDGVRLAAWRFGPAQADAVVLCPGWGGRGAQLGAFVPQLREAGYQVILFDHAGHGASEGREATLVHFIGGLDAVIAAAQSRGARIAGLIGHSLGAAAAGAWLNETGAGARAVLVAPPTSLVRYSRFFARRLGLPEKLRHAMQERFERLTGRRWQDFELPQSVAGVRAAALVIHDADDRDVGFASGLALARAWPGARFLATRGLGHRAILRDPVVTRDAVDFIASRVVFAPPPRAGDAFAFAAPAPLQ
jgi:pimeloyl-ACP methyl ester carboxylesterase